MKIRECEVGTVVWVNGLVIEPNTIARRKDAVEHVLRVAKKRGAI